MNAINASLGAALLAGLAVIASPAMAQQGSAAGSSTTVGTTAGATTTATRIAPADGSNSAATVMGANSAVITPGVPTVVLGGPSLQVMNAPPGVVNDPTFQRWMRLR